MKKIFLSLTIVYLCINILHVLIVKKTVYGDGIFYFAWLRSAVVDKNINFSNEFKHFIVSGHEINFTKEINIYPIGPALYWSQSYIPAHYIIRGDGYDIKYQLIISIHSVLTTIIGILVLYKLLSIYFNKKIANITTITIALSTNLLYYGAIDTVNSHAISFLFSVIFLFLTLQRQNAIVSGIFLGFLGLNRMQDIVIGLISIIQNKKKILIIAISCCIVLIFQMFIQKIHIGSWILSPYSLLQDYSFSFYHPKLFETLFSVHNGLFIWTPAILLSCIGLLLPNFPTNRIIFIIPILTQWWIISSWSTWWQGASYSGRMFISVLPFFAFGLAQLVTVIEKKYGYRYCLLLSSILITINIILIFYFLLYFQ